MLSRQLRRIGLLEAAVIVVLAAGVTFGALSLVVADGSSPTPMPRATAQVTTSAPAERHPSGQVASVVVDKKTGKVRLSGTLKTPKRKPSAPVASPAVASGPATADVEPTATARTSATSTASAIGQMIVTPVNGLTADAQLLARVKAGHVGGVILFGPNIATVSQVRALVAQLQGAATAGGRPKLMIMTDQEGGDVKRFRSAPPSQSAAAMGAAGPTAAFRQGRQTGAALLDRGVNVDLAPVADVPSVSRSFLGTRAFGTDPQSVAQASCQFAAGLRQANVASTLKHFPGLGRAVGNTDNQVVRIPASAGALGSDLTPYRRCANAANTMVMVSNAAYSGLTGQTPAVASAAAYGLLRTTLGFQGVAVSDSLNAIALAGVPDLAVTTARAGLDLQLWTSVAGAQSAYDQMRSAVKDGRLPAERVRQAAGRIRSLKETLGLA